MEGTTRVRQVYNRWGFEGFYRLIWALVEEVLVRGGINRV